MTEALKNPSPPDLNLPQRTHVRRRLPDASEDSSRIVWIATEKIRPNRAQPRINFESNAALRLADSIRRYGILQPLTVRVIENAQDSRCFEIIAGERRFRAAVMLQMQSVPCVILEADERKSAELALVENLLRQDLNFFEMAKAIRRLIDSFDLTQEEVAKRLSLTQSAVANKLRLLRFDEDEQQFILSSGLTERHARALLKMTDPILRKKAAEHVIKWRMNVSNTEQYIDRVLSEEKQKAELERSLSKPKMKPVIKDIRLFFNSVDHAVDTIKSAGIDILSTRTELENEYVIEIKVAKSYDRQDTRSYHAKK